MGAGAVGENSPRRFQDAHTGRDGPGVGAHGTLRASLGNDLRWRDHGPPRCALPLTGGAIAWRPLRRQGGSSGAALPLGGGQVRAAPPLTVQAQAFMAAGAGSLHRRPSSQGEGG